MQKCNMFTHSVSPSCSEASGPLIQDRRYKKRRTRVGTPNFCSEGSRDFPKQLVSKYIFIIELQYLN
jgi:hypothetical protein